MTAMGRSGHPGVMDHSVVDAVREAHESVPLPRRRRAGFATDRASIGERWMAPLLGVYLAWAVARFPEVFPAVFVPRLPATLMLIFMAVLAFGVPMEGWKAAWERSMPFRLLLMIAALAVITAPLGIWISGSVYFLRTKYIIALVVFLACFFFLRDRRNLRVAAAIFVILVTIVAFKVLHDFDPHRLVVLESGDVLPFSALTPDMQRVQVSASLDPNDYGALIATTLPLALWLSVGSLWRRILWTGTGIVMITSVAMTGSRSAFLGLVAVAGTLMLVGATGWKRTVLASVFGLAAVALVGAATTGQLDRLLNFSTDDYNVAGNEGRFFFWRQGLVWMIKRPWGYGINNFSTYFGWLNGQERAAHSIWIQYGMELGVLGLVLFVWLVTRLVRGNLRARRRALEGVTPATRESAAAAATLHGHVLAMLAGTLVTGSFLSNAYYPLLYMALGIAGAVLFSAPAPPAEAPASMAAAQAPRRAGGLPPGRLHRQAPARPHSPG